MARRQEKIKIKIAVAIDDQGHWGCAGGSGMSPKEALELATDGCETGFYKIYWLEAEVEPPRPVEITIDLPDEAIVEARP